MRARLAALSASGLLTLSLLGCAGPEATPRAEPERPAPAEVCRGVEKCRVVAEDDVDGDRLPDQVGLVVQSKRRATVLLQTADGRRLRHELQTTWFPRAEFFGTAGIDGEPGAELVVGTTMGAHTLWFTTLTVRPDGLVRLRPPGRENEWMIDGAFSFHAGVTRRVEGDRVVVVLQHAARAGQGARFTGQNREYAWRDGDWQHVRTVRTRYRNARAASSVAGWHVPGLPRFPQF